MKLPKAPGRGFNLRIILGFIFVFFGIIVFIQLFNKDLIKDVQIITDILKYGTALGSFIGGLFMLFRKRASIKI